MADTRKDKRAPVSLKVRFKSATVDEFIEHYSQDVSTGGIFIKSSKPLSIGTLLKFQFQLRDESALIRGVGRVVWVRATDAAAADQPAGMGIKFIKIDDESRAIVARVVEAHDGTRGEYEAGRGSATEAERPSVTGSDRPSQPSTDSAPPPGPSDNFFPSTSSPSELPAPEDRTAVRQAAEFLAAALSEGATDKSAAQAAELKADEARARTAQIEAQRRELEAAQRFARHAPPQEHLPSMIVDASVSQPSPPSLLTPASSSRPPIPAQPEARPSWSSNPPPSAASAQETWPAQGLDTTQPVAEGEPKGMYAAPARRASDPAFSGARAASTDAPDTSDLGRPAHATKARSPLVPGLVLAVVVVVAAFVAMRGRPVEELSDNEPAAGAAVAVDPYPTTPAPPEPAPSEPAPSEPAPTVAPQPEALADAEVAAVPDAAPEAVVDAAPAPEPAPSQPVAAAPPVLLDGGVLGQLDPSEVQVQVRTSPRSSRVFMNGHALPGKEPLLKMRIGEAAHFKATSPGRFPQELDFTPDATTKVLRFSLPALPFVLHVTSEPTGARIAAGTKRGDAPADINMADSVHGPLVVQARLPGYQLAKVTVPVSAFVERADAMVAELNIKLVPRPEGSPPEGDEEGAPAEAGPSDAPAPEAAPAEPAAP